MILVSIFVFSQIIWLSTFMNRFKRHQLIFAYLLIFFVSIVMLLVPVYKGHSLINLIYSFFGEPGYLVIIWSLFCTIRIVVSDFVKRDLSENVQVKKKTILFIFLVCSIYFISVLGLINMNIYYLSVASQALIVILFSIILFMIDKLFFVFLMLSFVPFAFFNSQNLTIFEFIFCPYLFVYSAGKLLYYFVLTIKNNV